MGSIDALIGALEQYEGTLVFISHDVHFIRAMAKTVLHIDSGRLTPYAGDYQYYLDKTKAASARDALTATLTNHQPTALSATTGQKPGGNRTKEQKRAEAQARQQRSQRKKELEARISAIESELASKEKRNTEVVTTLQDSAVWGDPAKAMSLQGEHDELAAAIEKLTSQWETLTSELEALTTKPEEAEQD